MSEYWLISRFSPAIASVPSANLSGALRTWADRHNGVVVTPVSEVERLRDEIEDLRESLQWALSNVYDPLPEDGEYAEDHGAATRLAWPDQPENWS